jgi:hypothetical protein
MKSWRGDTLTSLDNAADTRTLEEWTEMATNLVTEIAGNGEAILKSQYEEKNVECEVQILKLRTLATELKDDVADDMLQKIDEILRDADSIHAEWSAGFLDKSVLYARRIEVYIRVRERVQAIEVEWREVAAQRTEE